VAKSQSAFIVGAATPAAVLLMGQQPRPARVVPAAQPPPVAECARTRATVRTEPAKPGLVAMMVTLLARVPKGTGWLTLVRGRGVVLRLGWLRTGRSLGGATARSLARRGQPEPLEQ
jgi:hypothetical protein